MLSSKLVPTRNNRDPVKFDIKTEKPPINDNVDDDDEIIEIFEETTGSHYINNNNMKFIPFKKEPIDNNQIMKLESISNEYTTRIKQLELENKHLLEIIQIKSTENDLLKNNEMKMKQNETNLLVEINALKLKLNEYEGNTANQQSSSSSSSSNINNIEEIILSSESESEYETNRNKRRNKVYNCNFLIKIINLFNLKKLKTNKKLEMNSKFLLKIFTICL